ncbi:phage tail protein [Extensimonas vulgaris]|uniref:Putative tail protein n=1 Tax=Extensimonas vulgaris TaxID=1031594 RepID=A0A369AHN5_9BURK|nr:phage tail protein [Extensimonas vulgaris]RCX08633.1 putative tail protein [Extensimonas vulgaris]TWI36248.1 putative tail protein [Extensimonas vulgaris]TXD13971.1 phage tail protein [Extensimonas vulgaris]
MGGSSKKQTVGYRYRMGLHLVLCQGPVDAVQEIQMGERTAWGDAERGPLPSGHGLTSLSINKPTLFGGDAREGGVVGTVDVLSGGPAQGRNDYLMARLGSSIPAFRGVLSLVARKILFAANNPYIKPWAVRVRRFTAGWFGSPWMAWNAEVTAWDDDLGREISVGMNPAHILVQCLTDPHWGMGYPLDSIGGSFWNAAWALSSEGFGLNLIWTRQQSIENFIAQVLDHIGGILYTDPEQGTFELKLLRDDYWIDSLPQLGPDQIVRLERFERAQWGELPNELTVVYTDWQTGGDATVTVENLAAIQLQGGVINQRRDYPGVNYGPLAARLALRDLRALGSPLARMSLTVARDTLERAPLPGDVFLLNWPPLGIDQMVVRVTGIDTGTLGALEWRIEAMEDVFGLDNVVLAPPPPIIEEPQLVPLPPALVLAVEIPYWELARSLSRAELDYLTDTDAPLGALAAAGGAGQLNWQLATGASAGDLAAVVGEDYAPLLTLDAALPASETDAVSVPVTAISQPERLAVGDYAYLLDASGDIREAVAVLDFDTASARIDLARGVLDTTPQSHASGTRLIGVGEWLASEGGERAPGESVFVGAIPCTSTGQGDPVFAANGQPMLLAGRQALPYPPGRIRLNGQTEPAVVAGDLTVAWVHRDRTQQTAYLVKQDAGDIGPEPGVSYTLRIRDRTGAPVHTATGIFGNSVVWDVAGAAADAGALGDRVTLEITAVRDGLESWQPQVRQVIRAGYGLHYGNYYGGI